MVRLLVLEGADVDRFLYGVVERTADQSEAMPNLSDVVFRYLLSASPSFPVEDALYVAIQLGFMRSLQFIAKREADGNLQAPSIQPPVRSGTRGFDPKMQLSMVSYLVQKGIALKHSDSGPMRLHGDLCTQNPFLAEFLLQRGAYINNFRQLEDAFYEGDGQEQDEVSRNLCSTLPHPKLLQNPCFGHVALAVSSIFERFDIVRDLLEWGVRVTSPCAVSTVLRICDRGNKEDLHTLLSFGAPVHLERDFECECWNEISAGGVIDGFSPLQLAAKKGRADMVEVLLQAGASVDGIGTGLVASAGGTISGFYQDLTDEPYTWESTLSIVVEGGLEMVKVILDAGVDANEPPHELGGHTALQKAAEVGDTAIVEYLLDKQADVNAAPADWRGVTALQAAAINSHFDIAYRLLERGADPNAPGAEDEGRMALERAAEMGSIDMIQLLLDNGADIRSADFGVVQFENSVELAQREGFYAAARMLKRYRERLDTELSP